jgi:hypothetical protein
LTIGKLEVPGALQDVMVTALAEELEVNPVGAVIL